MFQKLGQYVTKFKVGWEKFWSEPLMEQNPILHVSFTPEMLSRPPAPWRKFVNPREISPATVVWLDSCEYALPLATFPRRPNESDIDYLCRWIGVAFGNGRVPPELDGYPALDVDGDLRQAFSSRHQMAS
jgi:hypothetical protein